MSGFLLASALVVAFVAGSVLSLRPSPRQRQLARLRERAVAAGLRVQWRPGGQDTGYLMPWSLPEAARGVALHFSCERPSDALWPRCGPSGAEAEIHTALSALPASVTAVRAFPEGVQALWSEAGTLADVDAIARALRELGAVLLRDR